MPRTIAVIGTLDTKGPEIAFLRDWIQARGHRALVIDPGILDQAAIEADVTRVEVASAGGAQLADLIVAGDKGRAMQLIAVSLHLCGFAGKREPPCHSKQATSTLLR